MNILQRDAINTLCLQIRIELNGAENYIYSEEIHNALECLKEARNQLELLVKYAGRYGRFPPSDEE